MHPRRSFALLCSALLLLSACATQPVRGGTPAGSQVPRAGPGATTPAAAVEQFLRLAERKQYLEMGWIFGTAQGPVMQRDPHPEVERRMFGLASILEHDQFAILREEPIPGTVGQGVRLTVQVRRGDRRVDVPFTVVRGPAERWYIDTVGLEAITAPR